ncbi:tetratricopeptide repeat protein, partial [Kibdelosporangium lantanae]
RAWTLMSMREIWSADASNLIGRQLVRLGRADDALPFCWDAWLVYKRFNQLEGEADALSNLGDIYRDQGHRDQAITCYQRSLDLDRKLGDRYWQASALVRLGLLMRELGDEEAARTHLKEGLTILRDLNHPDAEDVALHL